MTTTGAATCQNIIFEVAPSIVIAEEAAEVLEGHLLACLTPHTEHLILIGDHKQLRPSCADYHIAIHKNLEISLFERMMRANIDFKVLKTQRRMRPEISQLCKMHYSADIKDHESVLDRDQIKGVELNCCFFTHKEWESSDPDLKSHSNTLP
eukprot:UN27094